MSAPSPLAFTLKDTVAGVELAPATIALPLFNEYNNQVMEFLKGSGQNAVDLSESRIEIKEGSYRLNVVLPMLAMAAIQPDLDRLHSGENIAGMDPKRIKIVQKWQEAARKNPFRSYAVGDASRPAAFAKVDARTDYRAVDEEVWVDVEKYLMGRIVDAGGKSEANIHLEPEGGGPLFTIRADQDMLREDKVNRLYHDAMLHVSAKQSLRTGKLDHIRLIAFADYAPSFDAEEFTRMVDRGTREWADVPNATAWVEEQRGNTAS